MFNIETVIFVYMFVCISVIVFNVWSVISFQIATKKDKRRKIQIEKMLRVELEHPDQYQLRIFKHLRNIEYFNLFVDEVLQLSEEVRRSYLSRSLYLFSKLLIDYSTKEDIIRACFAYDISRLQLCDYGDEKIIQMMLQMISSDSSYCRENALKAIYNSHDTNLVIKAILLLNRSEVYHYDKLVIDGVLTFLGDKKVLGYELLGIYPELSDEYKIIVIQILRGIGDEYCQQVYQLYQVGYKEMDINIVIVRYFGRWHYEPFQEELYRLLSDENYEWELRAVCAYALRTYNNITTISLLKETINDSNWYIRYNSAESLTDMLKDKESISLETNDQYAQDIIRYMRQKNVLRKGDI